LDSTFLHDALQLSGDVFAATRHDKCDVVLFNVSDGTRRAPIDLTRYGNPVFMSFGS
jgi:hypothetical protein